MHVRIYGYSESKKLISTLESDDLTKEDLDIILEDAKSFFRDNIPYPKYREIKQILVAITD